MLLFLSSYAQNTDIEVTADIKSVTVYNSSAEINYQKTIALPSGKSTIVFTDLCPEIVENTINIFSTSQDVEIITVTDKINYVKEQKKQNVLIKNYQDSILKFDREIGMNACKIEVYTREKDLLFNGESIGGVSKGVLVSEIEKASIFFNKRYSELTTEIFILTENEKSLKMLRKKYLDQIQEMSANTSKSMSEIRVTVINNKSGDATFNFKFLTAKAGWAPIYDCKYQGVGKPLLFVFRANVFNASGVDWNNVDVKLSTANPTAGFDKPVLNQQKNDQTPNVNGIKFKQIDVSNTISEYDIKFKYSIPSDSKPYLVDVNVLSLNADFYYLLIPSIDPFSFLMAKIPSWNNYNLISGTTNIYNKGSFMGKTFLNTYAENDTLNIYLGKDNNVQAIRKESTQNYSNFIIGNYETEKSSVNIIVKNSVADTYNIQIIDQVPLFNEKDQVKFSIENIETALYNKQEGLLTWSFQIAGNQTKTIDYNFEIKIPKNEYSNYPQVRRRVRQITCPAF